MSSKKFQPQYSLNEIEFKVEPRIVKRENQYYLQYQISVPDSSKILNRMQVMAAEKNGKGYYYFGGKLSFREYGNLNERPLEPDRLQKYADQNAIFWINPDGSEEKLSIVDAN